ncbi:MULTISPECIES: CocE/NonD family hydrolase [unclassified Kitasatospora]|uniref:CocE/NonD family hydrolase n=1 Tax=unclassified Kitasatospora TaxID=2633591 RepID=UPI000708A07E|nr:MULTISPECIES: CocE/NonD family hydrolase [unclassified Kitasatospora]KQV21693.1 peptidase S15 [Kitasatospora sp. Root107]KRB75516.1 peptidase S15 [Kitasatospora sp. Root187]
MQHPDSYPYGTTREDLRIPLADGTELYARIWRPVTDQPVPALLEYLPYRLTDWTAPRDAQRHPWYAGHGYASVRVDVRGHGNSGGLPGDEYSAQELADGVAVVEWLAAQPWCSGRVGMFGISWGGFNSLQIAALAPPALQAVVTVCSTDDRYDNDVHYMGGSLLAVDMHAWSATMLAFVGRPPDPKYVGEDWRRIWRSRLEAVDPFIHPWLSHQTRDDYWRHGSVCEDYGAIKAAVLAVGGWADPYRDTVLRLVEHLDAPVRGIIGPWSHQYPDRGLPPGPAIGFLQETLRWWDHWLKDVDTGVLAEPALRTWMNESVPPATVYANRPGRWVGDESWPSPDVREIHYGLDDVLRTAGTSSLDRFVRVRSPQHTGVDAGRFFPFGNASDLPPDQREEDGRSVCFDTTPLPEPVEILGNTSVRLRVRCDTRRGQVIARLCDVAPDGSSTLVTRGVLNLTARQGRDRVVEWTPGSVEEVEFSLVSIAHAFPAGHRIRLALSSAYWPWIWPQPDAAGFEIDPGHSVLALPVRHLAADAGSAPITFESPEQSVGLDVQHTEPLTARPERQVLRDVATGEWRLEVDPNYGGSRRYPDGLIFDEQAVEAYRILTDDPLSATTRSDWTVRLQRPDLGWDVTVRTRSEITCDATHFTTRSRLTALEAGDVIFERDWERRIPRTAS